MQFEHISTNISIHRKFNETFTQSVLTATLKVEEIKTLELFESIFKIRHDAIHWLICQHRDIPFGEKHIREFDLDIQNHKYYNLIKEMSPDIIVINGRHIQVTELTISKVKTALDNKISKYRMLIDVLNDCGYNADIEVIVINSQFTVPDYGFLIGNHGFTVDLIEQIFNIVKNINILLHNIQETPLGRELSLKHREIILEEVDFPITDDDVLQFYDQIDRKPFNDKDDLKELLTTVCPDAITDEDNQFISKLVEKSFSITSALTKTQNARRAVSNIIKFHKDHQKKFNHDDIRSFMPLPYFEKVEIDSSKRSTLNDNERIISLLAYMESCRDDTLKPFGAMKGNISKVKLTNDQKREIAIHGPGRARYSRQGSIRHIEAQNKWKNVWFPAEMAEYPIIEELSWFFSECKGTVEEGFDGPGLSYVKACQSIFREININALRKERRENHILKPTGVKGVFVLIHKGAKLRTGEQLSIIWFRIIMFREDWFTGKWADSWCFKKLHVDENIMYSNWLSTDANRLDHYIRCYDKIIMAYACYSSFAKNRTMINEMCTSQSNTLGMIILIYMENKRSTSKLIQDARYLIMSILSMFTYYEDIIKKFNEPIRTPLQSYLLNRMLLYSVDPTVRQHVLSSKFGHLNVDSSTGEVFDRWAGTEINLPRLFTKGATINFKQMLCEMYFTMLFNKNQDDPTHASFQILSKILEGEASLNEVKMTTKLHTGYQEDDFLDMTNLVDKPHKNQFSRRAIIIASKLQSASIYNRSNNGLAHQIASKHGSLNKTLDEFATFKSSSTLQNLKFNPSVYNRRDSKEEDENDIKKFTTGDRNVQNRRRRCFEGVQELIEKDGCINSFDLVPKFMKEELIFQIFKKNQIGGVREILILDIKKRILINIMETVSRIICSEDEREMLTHGDKKNSTLRDSLRSLRRGDGKVLTMNYNFDKTRWAPSFMPIQFMYMFLPFKHLYPSLFRFITLSLMIHTNKKFLLPERLMRAWVTDSENNYKHWMDPNLQSLKEDFLDTKQTAYINESNMGQGILHYTSSYYHLCFISLRDEVFKRACIKAGIQPGNWRDLVSSDDSYTAHAMPMDNKKIVLLRIGLFLRCQEVCERVMNIWTSTSKSSISMLLYEFNSLFGSNLGMHPTTFKFALSSVHPVNTDSFFRMVKESYISCRQIVENGGSLELYEFASRLNRDYCETIYHTHEGGFNDFKQYGLRRDRIPYQLGIYPIMDPAIMIMFGPECRNYHILHKLNSNHDYLNEKERHIFDVMHTLIDIEEPELYASINNIDDVFVGVNRIEAYMHPIRKLEMIKRQITLTPDYIMDKIADNPILLFQRPKTLDDLRIKVYMKLFQKGAAEALRTTAASIYYGRVAASVSANAFKVPGVTMEQRTYRECIEMLFSIPSKVMDFNMLYPHYEEFSRILQLSHNVPIYEVRKDFETQNLRSLQLTKLQQRIKTQIVTLLEYHWIKPGVETKTQIERDWINLQSSVPVIRNTLEETIAQFKGDRKHQIKSLLLILLRLMGYSSRPMKAIIFGSSSRSYDGSYLILKQQNMFHDSTSIHAIGPYTPGISVKHTDRLCFAYNCFALSVIRGHYIDSVKINKPIPIHPLISDQDISMFLMDNTLSPSTRKKMLMMLLYLGRVDDITFWSERTKLIFHKWEVRSRRTASGYEGGYTLKLQLSNVILKVIFDGVNKITLSTNGMTDVFYMFELLTKAIEHSMLTKEKFLSMLSKGNYMMGDNKILTGSYLSGFDITVDRTISQIHYRANHIEHKSGYFILYEDDEQIFKTIEGLFHSDYIPEKNEFFFDIDLNKIRLSKIIHLRPFNTDFSVDFLSPSECADLLRVDGIITDLSVYRPHVTDITNRRLGINYPIRPLDDDYFSKLREDQDYEDVKLEEKKEDDRFDLIGELIDPSFLDNITTSVIDNILGNVHDFWIGAEVDIDLLKTMTRKKITFQPKQILEKVLNIKYQLIAKVVCNVNMLNKVTIKAIGNLTRNTDIRNSLIYCYDRQFTNQDVPSPHGCHIDINEKFDNIYHITPNITDDELE